MCFNCLKVISYIFLILVIIINVKASVCPKLAFGYAFGTSCELLCHCRNIYEQCDGITGNCNQSGCEGGWMGPGCQYRNIAFGQMTQHLDNLKYPYQPKYAGRATDLYVDTCSYTAEPNSSAAAKRKRDPFWKVWFPNVQVIERLVFKLKLDNLVGFQIFVENVTENRKQDRSYFSNEFAICYEHTNITLSEALMEIRCDKLLVGNQVRLTIPDRNQQIVLCDFKIYGGRELAYNQKTNQSTNFNSSYVSKFAVDGSSKSPSSCSLTKSEENPWWVLDFGQTIKLQTLKLYNYSGHIGPFSVYADTDGWTALYEENKTSTEEPTTIVLLVPVEVQKLKITRHVTYGMLGLCEVFAFGVCLSNRCGWHCEKACHCNRSVSPADTISGICTSGCTGRWVSSIAGQKYCDKECPHNQWGPACSNKCDNCFDNGPCRVDNGVCQEGCKAGYKPTPNCNEKCSQGTYGNNCSQNCSGHCKGNDKFDCDHVAGSCKDGCEAGWEGFYCDKECSQGTYGNNCSQNCSGHCKGNDKFDCDHVAGSCKDGCEAGWEGFYCDKECSQGTYGNNCSQNCSGHCKGNDKFDCDHVAGSCKDGCEAGWEGFYCDKECWQGTYGNNCSQNCSGHCKGNDKFDCDHVAGSCKDGCEAGWEGFYCDTECLQGRFGVNCSNSCTGHCEGGSKYDCNPSDGSCQNGCEAGWMGLTCDEECLPGFYGGNCALNCSGHCKENDFKCNARNGSCQKGCEAGWKGLICDEECPIGKYGENCSSNCTEHCKGEKALFCNPRDGSCQQGCEAGWNGSLCDQECTPGYYGRNCQSPCSGNCIDGEVCDRVSGNCTKGCNVGFTGAKCASKVMKLSNDVSSSTTSSTGGIAGGISSGFIVIIIIVIVLFILRRRHKSRGNKPSATMNNEAYDNFYNNTSEENNETNLQYANVGFEVERSSRNSKSSRIDKGTCLTETQEEPTEYMNTTDEALEHPLLPEHTIYLSDLGNYIKNKSQEEFEKEFQKLPTDAQFSMETALKHENKGKNRYKGLYPYDKSRLKLQSVDGIPGSDYINASFLDGYNQKPMYIAAQGPTESNVNDFWRMVYEFKIEKIVMVTSCVEEGKVKCIKYWPDDEEEFELIRVSLSAEEVFSDCTVRSLVLRQTQELGQHGVTQFHFTSWPDHGTPENIASLVHFWQKVRKGEKERDQVWLIHCSAGIGRTGTFIGLDYLYDEGKINGFINAFNCVKAMRNNRINMVQRKEQYRFLHEVICEALCSTNEPIPIEEYATEFCRLKEIDIASNKTLLRLEYEKMCSWTFHKYSDKSKLKDADKKEDEYSTAKKESNTSKNRFQDILPPDAHRPFLTTKVAECTNFINAVYIPMCKNSRGFIVTQNPLSSTVVDFYRLLYENDIRIIVSFDDEISTEAIAPQPGTQCSYGPFRVAVTDENENLYYQKRTVEFTYAAEESSKTVLQYIFKWKQNENVPTDLTVFVDFLAEIERVHIKDESNPILVKCLNGADKSGLFCVIWNVLERMRIDGEVAIPHTIRNLRHRRQQIIPNFEQYSFCHDAILRHTESSDIYANV